MPKIHLILVDDHLLFTAGLVASLEKENEIEIMATFSEAKKALQFLKTKTPDLVITDISMPSMNGVEFIKKIKIQNPSIKIMVVSMYQNMISPKEIDGYLLKDSPMSLFLETIKKIVLEDTKCFQEETTPVLISEFHTHLLSQREKEIVGLIASEFTVNKIAKQLFISPLTVESHKKNIFLKLQVHTNAGLIKKAMSLGYLS